MRSRRKSRNLTKLKIKNSTRVLLMLLFLVIFAFSSASFLDSLFNNKVTKIEENVYTYKNEYKSDYNVNIKSNPFITEKSLPAGQTYISDLIDSIDMELDYKYSGSTSTLINYDYKIDAVLGASYTNDGEELSVWNKTYNIKTVDSQQSNDDISIKEKIDVDFKKYNEEVKNFKQTLGMSIDAFLYIKLTVNTNTTINHQDVKNQYVSNFSISLGDKVAVVNEKNNDTKVGSVKHSNTIEDTDVNVVKVIFSMAFVLISIYGMYFVRYKTKKFNTIRNEFKLELNRILKSCQDRIVIVKNQFETEDENVIDVKDFGELIKLSEELFKPILCWMSDDINDEQAWFSVLSNKIRYRFILKK